MKLRFLGLLGCGATVALSLPAADAATRPPSVAGETPKSVKSARQPLEKGMAAARVVGLIGQPQEVKPMKAPAGLKGPAEIWIYRQSAGSRPVQVVTGERDIPVYAGPGQGNQMKTAKEPVYTMKQVKLYRVTSLLMVDGKLVVAKQTLEQSEVYD